jgi:hypothetical protein
MPLLRTLLLNGLLGLAGYWTARHGFRIAAGLPRALAAFTLAWSWAILGMECLGPLGFLSYGPLLTWTVAGLGMGWLLRQRDRRAAEVDEFKGDVTDTSSRWETSAIVALGLILWATVAHGMVSLLGPVKVISDGPIYHLYFAVRWWKAARLFLVAAPFGDVAATYFPAVGDLSFTWLLVGWGGDRLAKVGQVPFLLVAALAAYASARRVGAGISASVIAVCCFVSVFPFFLFSLEANVDTIVVAGYLLSACFLTRYALADETTGALAIAALALGGVLGTKPTGIVFGSFLFGAAGLAIVARRLSLPRRVFHPLLLGTLPLVMAGAWYGNNLRLTGNPLYPLHLEAFGHVWLSGWYGPGVMRLSQYYIPLGNWRALIDQVLAVFDPRLVPLWGAALIGAWQWSWSRRSRPRAVGILVWCYSALAALNLAAFWLLVPYRTQQRFMFQAAGLLVVPLACLFDRGRWLRVLGTALLSIHMFTSQGWLFCAPDEEPPWNLTAVVPNIVPPLLRVVPAFTANPRRVSDPDDLFWTSSLLAVGAASLLTAWLWSRSGRWATVRAVLGSLALFGLGLVLWAPFGTPARIQFFPPFEDYVQGWLQLDDRSGPAGARIAYSGTNLPYYLMGTSLRNNVQYVNLDAHRGWLMHDYHRLARARGTPTWPNPWPTWDRAHPDYAAWLENLHAAAIQFVVVASMGRPPGALPDEDREGFPIERRWAESHPESFQPVYGVIEKDSKFRIYRVRPGTG